MRLQSLTGSLQRLEERRVSFIQTPNGWLPAFPIAQET